MTLSKFLERSFYSIWKTPSISITNQKIDSNYYAIPHHWFRVPYIFCVICWRKIRRFCQQRHLLVTLSPIFNKKRNKGKKGFCTSLQAFTGDFWWITWNCIIYRTSTDPTHIDRSYFKLSLRQNQLSINRKKIKMEHCVLIVPYFSVRIACYIDWQ